VCDLETSRIGASYIYDISRLRVKELVSVHYTAFQWACQMYCEGYCYGQQLLYDSEWTLWLVHCFGKSEILIEMQSLKNFQIISQYYLISHCLAVSHSCLEVPVSCGSQRTIISDIIPHFFQKLMLYFSCSNLYASDYIYLYFFGIFVLLNKEHKTTCRYKKKPLQNHSDIPTNV